MKKLFIALIMFGLVLSTAGIRSGNVYAAEGKLSDITIGIVGYDDSGTAFEAIRATYNQISRATGINFKFVKGSTYDEAANVTAVQNLIAAGANGIIMNMDSGTQSIMREAKAAHVYVAGFLNSMDRSLSKIKDNEYFLGTVNDGYINGAKIGEKAAELVIKNEQKNIGLITFPHIYFPSHAQADKAFRAAIDNYNKTADDKDKVTVQDSIQLSFESLDPTYFNKYPDLDAIFGMALTFVYPTMVSSNVDDITLYATGFDTSESYMDGFKKGTIGMETCSNPEALVYPVALIANAIEGTQYADKPAEAEAVETDTVFLTNEKELNAFKENAIFYTGDDSHSLLSDDDIRNLIKVFNKDATYENLVNTIQSWSIEDIMAK